MKIDLTVHIADFVNRYKSIALPGIGVFSKRQTSASVDQGGKVLTPPSTTLVFDGTLVKDDGFARFIAKREGIAFEQAIDLLEVFAQRKQRQLLDQGQVGIYPLGTLKLTEDQTVFESADNRLINNYFGLQPISVEPLVYDQPAKVSSTSQSQAAPLDSLITVEQEDDKSIPWWRWLLILLLAALLVLLYRQCSSDEGQTSVQDSASTSTVDTQVYVTTAAPEKEDSPEDRKSNSTTLTEATGQGDFLHIDDVNDGVIDSLLADQELRFAPGTEMVECVIILGSFRKQRNAIRMMADVEEAGYDLYIGVHGDYTRVGLTYNCAKEELVSYLQEIRRKFVRKAWYLTPELHVEY